MKRGNVQSIKEPLSLLDHDTKKKKIVRDMTDAELLKYKATIEQQLQEHNDALSVSMANLIEEQAFVRVIEFEIERRQAASIKLVS
jgi:hypothetical protein